MSEQRFEYARRPVVLAFSALVAGGCGALLFYIAASGDEVRMRMFFIPVELSGGPIYLLSMLAFAAAIIGVYGILKPMIFGPSVLVVTDDWLDVPVSPIRRAVVRVRRDDVRAVARFTPGGRRITRLETDERKLEISTRFVGDAGVDAVEAWLVTTPR